MTPAPAGVEVATPADWLELDLTALGDVDVARSLVDARVAEVPDLSEHRDDLIDVFMRTAEDAARAGVSFAAVLADARRETPLLANVTMLAFAPTDTEPDEGEVIELACGPTRRIEQIHRFELQGTNGELAMLIVRYLIPIPGTNAVQVLAFSSPTEAHRQELVQSFHVIADSVRFRWD